MANGPTSPIITDGSADFSQGIDSIKVATVAGPDNPNGLTRQQLAWLINGTVRTGGIQPRDSWVYRGSILAGLPYMAGKMFQGEFNYVPQILPAKGGSYKLYVIGGHIIKADPEFFIAPVDLSEVSGISFMSTNTKAYFVQAEQFVVIQSGNYNPVTQSGELPIIWDGSVLTRSNGITGITQRGTSNPTEYAIMLPAWTSPAAGDSLTFSGATYPGNLYDKVVISTTAGAWICTAAITAISANSFSIEVDTKNSGSANAAATYDFTVGYNGSNVSMVGQAQTVAVPFNASAQNVVALSMELDNTTVVITFASDYMYPGTVGDQIIAYTTDSTKQLTGTVVANSVPPGQPPPSNVLTLQLQNYVSSVPPWVASGPLNFLLVFNVQANQSVFSLPTFVGQRIAVPFPTNTPDTYIGSIGDTISFPGGGSSYMVVGYGGLLSWQAGTGVILQATAIAGSGQIPTNFTLTIYGTPSTGGSNINQIPSAGPMAYFMGRLWYAQGQTVSAGDIVGGPSGTIGYNFLDSVLCVTENPLALGGDGFTMPAGADIITGLAIPQMINASLGQGLLYIGTANAVFSLQVPVTRADWIAANSSNQPFIAVVQSGASTGFVNDTSVVPVNGDLWYTRPDGSISSLLTAVRYFGQWGGVNLSSNEDYILSQVNTAYLFYGSGVYFNNRLLVTTLPQQTPFGVVYTAIIPLDLTTISTLEQQDAPNWEGNYTGLQVLSISTAVTLACMATSLAMTKQRAFITSLSTQNPGQMEIWEIVPQAIGDNNGSQVNRIQWQATFPGFDFGKLFELKELLAGELWIDQLQGVVDFEVEYAPDGSSCFYKWYAFRVCSATDSTKLPNPDNYPVIQFQPGVRKPLVLPKPLYACAGETSRPAAIAYEFQLRMKIAGNCRIRGIRLHGSLRDKALYQRIA